MRTIAIVAAAALALAGCATGPTAVEGSPPVRHVAISGLPEQAAHDGERPLDRPPGPTDRSDPAGIEPSVGSVGDSHDNSLAESVIGLFKTEVIRRRGPWRNLEAVEVATLE